MADTDPTEPLPPVSGIVFQVHFYCPGGNGGVVDISVDDGAGRQTNAQLRPWDQNAQLSWGGEPCTAGDAIGRLAERRANVVFWPLRELGGAALRADFREI